MKIYIKAEYGLLQYCQLSETVVNIINTSLLVG